MTIRHANWWQGCESTDGSKCATTALNRKGEEFQPREVSPSSWNDIMSLIGQLWWGDEMAPGTADLQRKLVDGELVPFTTFGERDELVNIDFLGDAESVLRRPFEIGWGASSAAATWENDHLGQQGRAKALSSDARTRLPVGLHSLRRERALATTLLRLVRVLTGLRSRRADGAVRVLDLGATGPTPLP